MYLCGGLFSRLHCCGGFFAVPRWSELFFLPWTEALLGRLLRVLSPSPERRLVDPFHLVVPDHSLQGHSTPLNIDFELQLIIVREGDLELMPNTVTFLELSHQFIHTQLILAQLIVLAVLALHCHQGKLLLACLDVIGQVKVEPARGDGHDVPSSYQLEIGLNGDLILIELLLG